MNIGFTTKAMLETEKTVDEVLINSIAGDIQKSHDIAYDYTMTGNVIVMKPKFRLTFQRNSFWQVVKCELTKEDMATILNISCCPIKSLYHFLTFYMTFATLMEILFVSIAVTDGMENYFPLFIPVILVAFAYLFVKIASSICSNSIIKIIEKHCKQ